MHSVKLLEYTDPVYLRYTGSVYWVDVWLHERPYSDENIILMRKWIEEIKSGNVTSEEAKYLKHCAELCTWKSTM